MFLQGGNKRLLLPVFNKEAFIPGAGPSMFTLASMISGLLFVLLAGLNPWIMLTNRGNSERSGRLWMCIHRTVGYAFIVVFAVTVYFMLLRLKGNSNELPPRILLHMSLALILAPLLFVKVLVARYQPPGSPGLLRALGIAIFAFSFTLVAVNVLTLLLRHAKDDSVPPVTSAIFVVLVLAVVGTLLLTRRDSEGNSTAKMDKLGDPNRSAHGRTT